MEVSLRNMKYNYKWGRRAHIGETQSFCYDIETMDFCICYTPFLNFLLGEEIKYNFVPLITCEVAWDDTQWKRYFANHWSTLRILLLVDKASCTLWESRAASSLPCRSSEYLFLFRFVLQWCLSYFSSKQVGLKYALAKPHFTGFICQNGKGVWSLLK